MNQQVSTLLTEYLGIVDSIHGAYLDAITGFAALIDEYERALPAMRKSRPEIPADAFDGALFVYGTGHPRQPRSTVVHACTQGEYRARNALGGRNHVVVGQLCLVNIFGYWEDCYRGEIANVSGKSKAEVTIDILGDLRLLRNSIVHHRGVAKKDVERCTLLSWFREGDDIALTYEHFETIVERLKRDLTAYCSTL